MPNTNRTSNESVESNNMRQPSDKEEESVVMDGDNEKCDPSLAFSACSEKLEDKARIIQELSGLAVDADSYGDIVKVSPPPSYVEEDTVVEIEDVAENEEGTTQAREEEDPWSLVITPSTGKPWKELSVLEKIQRVCIVTVKVIIILLLLYLFICSLDLLGAAFQLVGGRTAGEAFKSPLLQNPLVGLIIGIWVTVILQSSSTTTSIVVAMVAANIISVEQAIYIIMGSNIGTSFTSSLVALGQVAERNQFRRAFAGAIVLYMFNLLTVIVLLPLEWFTGYLYHVTKAIVDSMDLINAAQEGDDEPKFLSVITDPFISLIIQVDKGVVTAIAEESFEQKRPLTKYLCEEVDLPNYTDYPLGTDVTQEEEYITVRDSKSHPLLWAYSEEIENVTLTDNGTQSDLITNDTAVTRFSYMLPDFDDPGTQACKHLFVGAGLPSEYQELDGWPRINLSDGVVGVILLVISLVALCACLIGMVKLLNSILKGTVLGAVRNIINSDLPGGVVGREITGYFVILIGAFLTILVQSSSVFTSALNPLVGMGIVTIERTYPLTLGANIGTTFTALLAAFTAEPETIANALQVAFAHLFFNLTGILMFYPIPKIRKLPCWLSQQVGDITADYKWFAVFFLTMTYIVLPLIIFLLSIPGWKVLFAVLIPAVVFFTIIIIINVMQYKCSSALPRGLRSWDWLPLACHSLDPYDQLLRKMCPFKICRKEEEPQNPSRRHSVDDIPPITMEIIAGQAVEVKDKERDGVGSTAVNDNDDSGNVSLDGSCDVCPAGTALDGQSNVAYIETEHL